MPDTIALDYDLLALPTAQHRAGLAGLLILLETMRRRRLPNVPNVGPLDYGRMRVHLDQASFTAVFNELYDATVEETESPKQWKDRAGDAVAPLRIETRTTVDARSKEKTQTIYVYRQVVPRAGFLKALDMRDVWIKLWREARNLSTPVRHPADECSEPPPRSRWEPAG